MPSGIVSLQSQAIKFRNSNFVIKEVNYMVKASKGPGIRLRNKRHFVMSISFVNMELNGKLAAPWWTLRNK